MSETRLKLKIRPQERPIKAARKEVLGDLVLSGEMEVPGLDGTVLLRWYGKEGGQGLIMTIESSPEGVNWDHEIFGIAESFENARGWTTVQDWGQHVTLYEDHFLRVRTRQDRYSDLQREMSVAQLVETWLSEVERSHISEIGKAYWLKKQIQECQKQLGADGRREEELESREYIFKMEGIVKIQREMLAKARETTEMQLGLLRWELGQVLSKEGWAALFQLEDRASRAEWMALAGDVQRLGKSSPGVSR